MTISLRNLVRIVLLCSVYVVAAYVLCYNDVIMIIENHIISIQTV